jgi:hypothetical protein
MDRFHDPGGKYIFICLIKSMDYQFTSRLEQKGSAQRNKSKTKDASDANSKAQN